MNTNTNNARPIGLEALNLYPRQEVRIPGIEGWTTVDRIERNGGFVTIFSGPYNFRLQEDSVLEVKPSKAKRETIRQAVVELTDRLWRCQERAAWYRSLGAEMPGEEREFYEEDWRNLAYFQQEWAARNYLNGL